MANRKKRKYNKVKRNILTESKLKKKNNVTKKKLIDNDEIEINKDERNKQKNIKVKNKITTAKPKNVKKNASPSKTINKQKNETINKQKNETITNNKANKQKNDSKKDSVVKTTKKRNNNVNKNSVVESAGKNKKKIVSAKSDNKKTSILKTAVKKSNNVSKNNIENTNNLNESAGSGNKLLLPLILFSVFMVISICIIIYSNEKSIEYRFPENRNATIQYDRILVGTMLEQDKENYYVLISNSKTDNYILYINQIASNMESSNKIYVIDMFEPFNEGYYGSKNNITSNLKRFEIKEKEDVLLEIKNGEIFNEYYGVKEINKKIIELTK